MRVVGGKYRALKLADFQGDEIRPTADRVKESLFNLLYGRVSGSRALDLFCGSGSLGIECISRGAAEVIFNDVSKSSLAVLGKNLAKLKGESCYKVLNYDFTVCLQSLSGGFDLIFIDPPYRLEAGHKALEIISKRGLLTPNGIAVLERDRAFSGDIAGLEVYDERRYGITYLTFFRVK